MNTRILDAEVSFCEQPFTSPLLLSSGAVTALTQAKAAVTVEIAGRRARGVGATYLSDLWAWPDPSRPHAQRDAVLRAFCRTLADRLPDWCGGAPAHPLELGLHLHERIARHNHPAPILARLMAASPFDAAIHDAAGQVLNRSAFAFYGKNVPIPTADRFFRTGTVRAIRALLRQRPKHRLLAWYVAGVKETPDTLAPWVRERGYRCFKVKIMGRDPEADAAQTAALFRMVLRLGARHVRLTADANEASPSARHVLDFFHHLQRRDAAAFDALLYAEQPTSREIEPCAFDWHEIVRLKPVLLDEGLTSLERMILARNQGWSGFALKTCKGHSFALTAAAWAHENGLLISLQDLTNPGFALLHAALFAAHVPTLNDAELNSPQFTPTANEPFRKQLPGLFDPRGGFHRLPNPSPPGLGSRLLLSENQRE